MDLGLEINVPIINVNTPQTLKDDPQFQARFEWIPAERLGAEQQPSPIKYLDLEVPVPEKAPRSASTPTRSCAPSSASPTTTSPSPRHRRPRPAPSRFRVTWAPAGCPGDPETRDGGSNHVTPAAPRGSGDVIGSHGSMTERAFDRAG